nr:hypothetical protein CFP56_20579 [Quercus suber]
MRDAASTIIEYLISLSVDQLQEFWLPCKLVEVRTITCPNCLDTAQLLVSASTTLSRCVIEASDAKEKTDLVAKLVDLLHYLQTTCQAAEWELGNLCLEQCGRFIKKYAAQEPSVDRNAIGATLPSPEVIQNGSVARINFIPSMSLAERFDPSDCLDGLWDPLWMDFNEFWQAPNLPS